eukprot:5319121-Amphidinium_carterae.1
MTGSNHEVVCLLPPDRATGGVEASRLRLPPQAIAQRAEVSHRASASASFLGVSPLRRRGWPALAIVEGPLPGSYCV